MGRITIFCADGCPHSRRMAAALKQRDIPYTEISITQFPDKRQDMIALSNRLSTPQVFFNTRHVGGVQETLELLHEWDNDKTRYATAAERYQEEIGQFYDPSNPRFAIPPPETAVQVEAGPPRGRDEYSIVVPWCAEKATVLEMTETLKQVLPSNDAHYKRFTLQRRVFTGACAVQALQCHYQVEAGKAETLAQHLLDEQVIVAASSSASESSTPPRLDLAAFYRLQCYAEPSVLNSYRVWKEEFGSTVTPEQLLYHLSNLMSRMLHTLTDEEGRVDFVAGQTHPLYAIFEEAVCALQKVSLAEMTDDEKTAFGINLYNLMIKYAFIKVGAGDTDYNRLLFFNRVQFNVGGHLYSFQDWENGILRGNRKAPYALYVQFLPKDPRLAFMVQNPDCRMHFALNCGALSCPPVNYYTAANLQNELRLAAAAFGEDEGNVSIDLKRNTLKLSRIFAWYKVDFVEHNKQYPVTLLSYLHGVKKQEMDRLIFANNSDKDKTTTSNIKIVFAPYDWSTNAKRIATFSADSLKQKERSMVKTLLPSPNVSPRQVLRKGLSKLTSSPASPRKGSSASPESLRKTLLKTIEKKTQQQEQGVPKSSSTWSLGSATTRTELSSVSWGMGNSCKLPPS